MHAPTKITGIDLYVYHTPKFVVEVPQYINYISPLPRLLQIKLLGQTSPTPPKCDRGPTKYIEHLTSTPPLPWPLN